MSESYTSELGLLWSRLLNNLTDSRFWLACSGMFVWILVPLFPLLSPGINTLEQLREALSALDLSFPFLGINTLPVFYLTLLLIGVWLFYRELMPDVSLLLVAYPIYLLVRLIEPHFDGTGNMTLVVTAVVVWIYLLVGGCRKLGIRAKAAAFVSALPAAVMLFYYIPDVIRPAFQTESMTLGIVLGGNALSGLVAIAPLTIWTATARRADGNGLALMFPSEVPADSESCPGTISSQWPILLGAKVATLIGLALLGSGLLREPGRFLYSFQTLEELAMGWWLVLRSPELALGLAIAALWIVWRKWPDCRWSLFPVCWFLVVLSVIHSSVPSLLQSAQLAVWGTSINEILNVEFSALGPIWDLLISLVVVYSLIHFVLSRNEVWFSRPLGYSAGALFVAVSSTIAAEELLDLTNNVNINIFSPRGIIDASAHIVPWMIAAGLTIGLLISGMYVTSVYYLTEAALASERGQ